MWDHRRGREELERRRVEQRARLEAEAKWLVEERKRREEEEQKHAEEERASAEEEKALRAMQEAALLQKQVRDVVYEYCTVLESALVRLPSDIYVPSKDIDGYITETLSNALSCSDLSVLCVPERGGGDPGQGEGRAAEAGERKTLPGGGGTTTGEKKGERQREMF